VWARAIAELEGSDNEVALGDAAHVCSDLLDDTERRLFADAHGGDRGERRCKRGRMRADDRTSTIGTTHFDQVLNAVMLLTYVALKQGDDYSRLWGGISGCQSTRQLLLARDRLDLSSIAAITSTNIARRFGLKGKGDIGPGFDADLWLVDLNREDVIRREDLLYRNSFSVHEWQRVRGRTVRTLVRGRDAGLLNSAGFLTPDC